MLNVDTGVGGVVLHVQTEAPADAVVLDTVVVVVGAGKQDADLAGRRAPGSGSSSDKTAPGRAAVPCVQTVRP